MSETLHRPEEPKTYIENVDKAWEMAHQEAFSREVALRQRKLALQLGEAVITSDADLIAVNPLLPSMELEDIMNGPESELRKKYNTRRALVDDIYEARNGLRPGEFYSHPDIPRDRVKHIVRNLNKSANQHEKIGRKTAEDVGKEFVRMNKAA